MITRENPIVQALHDKSYKQTCEQAMETQTNREHLLRAMDSVEGVQMGLLCGRLYSDTVTRMILLQTTNT